MAKRLVDTLDRNEEICAMHHAGLTYASIAKQFGISGQRVRQIVKKRERLNRTRTHPLPERME